MTNPIPLPLSRVQDECHKWFRQLDQHTRGIIHPGQYAAWDRLTPQKRKELLDIWEEGNDNITRWKLGGPKA